MFRHVVMFSWKTDATPRQIADAEAGLAGLPARIESLREYRFGPDAGLADANWDFVVVADFDDEAGYLLYRDHEAHRAVIAELMSPIIEERVAVQYDAGP